MRWALILCIANVAGSLGLFPLTSQAATIDSEASSGWDRLAVSLTRNQADFRYCKELISVIVDARNDQGSEYVVQRFLKGAKLDEVWKPGSAYYTRAVTLVRGHVKVNHAKMLLMGTDIKSGFSGVWREDEAASVAELFDSEFGVVLKQYYDTIMATAIHESILRARGFSEESRKKAAKIFDDAAQHSKDVSPSFVSAVTKYPTQYESFKQLVLNKDVLSHGRIAFREWTERADAIVPGLMPSISKDLYALVDEWYRNDPAAKTVWQPK